MDAKRSEVVIAKSACGDTDLIQLFDTSEDEEYKLRTAANRRARDALMERRRDLEREREEFDRRRDRISWEEKFLENAEREVAAREIADCENARQRELARKREIATREAESEVAERELARQREIAEQSMIAIREIAALDLARKREIEDREIAAREIAALEAEREAEREDEDGYIIPAPEQLELPLVAATESEPF
jgi:hypothetical protein